MTITLSAELCAPKDIHTARQTNTLQRTPRKNNWIVGKAALVDAMTSAVLPTAPPPRIKSEGRLFPDHALEQWRQPPLLRQLD